MQNTRSQSPDDLKRILTVAGRKIAAGIEPAEFLKWFRTSTPGIAPEFARAMAQADIGSGAMLYCMGRVLWNAMPQPSNRYRSRALPTPARNGRCPCGSGKKYKQCGATLNPPDHLFGSLNLLRFVLDSETKASLKRIDTRLMDPASLDDVARQWSAEGNFEKALLLLEPLFDSEAKFPKHAELLLDTLFDIWPAHHKPTRRSKLAERLASDTNLAVACTALHRCIMMLAINPDDNHAFRGLVSSELLRQQWPIEALRLLELYPDDFLCDVLMNRTLALYCLDRRDEAAVELRKGGSTFRKIRKGINQENFDRPKDIDYDAIGSRDEAWLYPQAMRHSLRV